MNPDLYLKSALKLREAFKKKNCDYSDIVPISFYTHPPEGDRDSNYRDKINVISTPPLPPVVGTFKLKIIRLKCAKFYKLPANYSREFWVWTPPSRGLCPYNNYFYYRDFD